MRTSENNQKDQQISTACIDLNLQFIDFFLQDLLHSTHLSPRPRSINPSHSCRWSCPSVKTTQQSPRAAFGKKRNAIFHLPVLPVLRVKPLIKWHKKKGWMTRMSQYMVRTGGISARNLNAIQWPFFWSLDCEKRKELQAIRVRGKWLYAINIWFPLRNLRMFFHPNGFYTCRSSKAQASPNRRWCAWKIPW